MCGLRLSAKGQKTRECVFMLKTTLMFTDFEIQMGTVVPCHGPTCPIWHSVGECIFMLKTTLMFTDTEIQMGTVVPRHRPIWHSVEMRKQGGGGSWGTCT